MTKFSLKHLYDANKKMAMKLDPYMEFEGKFLNAILLTWVGFSKFNFGSTWNAKCPIFLGNFAPKSATIALKIGHQRLSR